MSEMPNISFLATQLRQNILTTSLVALSKEGKKMMDIASLEEEARNTALKHVATLFQRPDQLQKVEQHKKKCTRKKASVEAMLKTGVSSQLEDVRTGLAQLDSALHDIRELQESLKIIEETFHDISPMKDKLRRLKEQSMKRSQYATAMENVQHIYMVPETIEKTQEAINEGKLLLAHKNIMELEGARNDLLLEMHRQKVGNDNRESKLLEKYFSGVHDVSESLGKQMWYILTRTLDSVRAQPTQIVNVLRIIEREEKLDESYTDQHKLTGFIPPYRPKRWREKAMEILQKTVKTRIEGMQLQDRSDNKHWLVIYLELVRQKVVEDLTVVRVLCEQCFPPHWKISNKYVQMYHTVIAERLKEIASDDLEKTEIIQLLGWLKIYSGPELLGNPLLRIDVEKLLEKYPLVTKEDENKLTEKFLAVTEADLKEWLEKALDHEKDDWYKNEPPETDSLDYFYTSMPSILFGMVEDQVQLAKEISDLAVVRVMEVCIDALCNFTERYKDAFMAYRNKHFEDRSRFEKYTAIMIAVANNSQICCEYCEKVRGQAKARYASTTNSDRPLRATLLRIDALKDYWTSNVQTSLSCLLDEVYEDFQPHLVELLSKTWIRNPSPMDTICATLADYNFDHKHLKPQLQHSLLTSVEVKILKEFVVAVEKRRLTFANYEERKIAGEQIEDEGKKLEELLQRLTPPTHEIELLTGILPAMAEVLILRDKSLLPLEVSSFVQKFPDITQDQLSGLLQLREDMNRADARQLATDLLQQNRFRAGQNSPFLPLFLT